ncbi:type II toxin-antitoxin system RelE/ParE family toxin [Bacillus toyonensis]|uniref:type II toxin-antitoxin system RelE/ParE family toxin n=1 Tax=Bacillus toyonensis TaxID=155322 RepID=UPI003467CB5F
MKIEYYTDGRGRQEVYEWVLESAARDMQTFNRFTIMTNFLKANGPEIRTQKIKHPDIKYFKGEKVWQLRVHDHRVMFFYFEDDTIVFLNYFVKKQGPTPTTEKNRAKKHKNKHINRKP